MENKKTEEVQERLTFESPTVMRMDKRLGYKVVDEDASEPATLLEALGAPKVFYMARQNKYFKDSKCTNEFSDAEVTALGLQIPAEIESARRKVIKAANDAGKPVDFRQLLIDTSPKVLAYPKHIADRLKIQDPLERTINRIKNSTTGM